MDYFVANSLLEIILDTLTIRDIINARIVCSAWHRYLSGNDALWQRKWHQSFGAVAADAMCHETPRFSSYKQLCIFAAFQLDEKQRLDQWWQQQVEAGTVAAHERKEILAELFADKPLPRRPHPRQKDYEQLKLEYESAQKRWDRLSALRKTDQNAALRSYFAKRRLLRLLREIETVPATLHPGVEDWRKITPVVKGFSDITRGGTCVFLRSVGADHYGASCEVFVFSSLVSPLDPIVFSLDVIDFDNNDVQVQCNYAPSDGRDHLFEAQECYLNDVLLGREKWTKTSTLSHLAWLGCVASEIEPRLGLAIRRNIEFAEGQGSIIIHF